MAATLHSAPNRCLDRRSLTLVEAIVSMMIIGVMLVAALNTVGASQSTQKKMGDRQRALLLAEDLLSEISRQHYEDPDLAPGSFGLSGGEVGDGSRALWEDVDDYDDWTASPPQEKDGTVMSDLPGWRRSVIVDWVNPADLSQIRVSDTGVKRVTVVVTLNDVPLATLESLRTNTMDYHPESD